MGVDFWIIKQRNADKAKLIQSATLNVLVNYAYWTYMHSQKVYMPVLSEQVDWSHLWKVVCLPTQEGCWASFTDTFFCLSYTFSNKLVSQRFQCLLAYMHADFCGSWEWKFFVNFITKTFLSRRVFIFYSNLGRCFPLSWAFVMSR